MTAAPRHHCRILRTPWKEAYGTHAESGVHYEKHAHGTFGIGVLEHGAQRSASGRGPVEAFAGQVLTTNPGEVHDGRPFGAASRRWRMVYLEPAFFCAFGARADREIERPVIDDGALASTLRRLFLRLDAWARVGKCGDAEALACEETLSEACSRVLHQHAGDPGAAAAGKEVERMRERLGDHAGEAPSLEELARIAGLSRFQALRRFQRAYRLPPHAWLLQQRVERARGLIRAGERLSDAAARCGFADQSHMTRAFVRRYGFTPGAWRRACNSVQD